MVEPIVVVPDIEMPDIEPPEIDTGPISESLSEVDAGFQSVAGSAAEAFTQLAPVPGQFDAATEGYLRLSESTEFTALSVGLLDESLRKLVRRLGRLQRIASGTEGGGGNLPGFQGGSGRFLNFSPMGTAIEVHGREEIVTEEHGRSIAGMVGSAIRDARAGGGGVGGAGGALSAEILAELRTHTGGLEALVVQQSQTTATMGELSRRLSRADTRARTVKGRSSGDNAQQ
jgi:hypothetical protein